MSDGEVYYEEAQRAVESVCKERDELKARVEYLRDVLIAMINEHTGDGIPEEVLKGHSDEVLCAEAALAFRVTQILMIKFKERADKLEKNQFTREEIDFIKKAISMAILDCETNPPKPSDEKINLMWSIKAKCDEFLKGGAQ